MVKRALFYIYSVSGGAGKNFIFVANHLAAQGWDIDVFYSAGRTDMLRCFNKGIKLKGLTCQSGPRFVRALMTVAQLLKALCTGRYDCAFSTGYSNNALLIMAAFLSRYKGRLILRSALSLKAYQKIRPYKFLAIDHVYKLCRWCHDACLISLNADMHKEIKQYILGGKNITKYIIGNPVNVREIRDKSKVPLNFKHVFKNKELRLFSVGRLVEEKNFYRVFEVVESLSGTYDCVLILIGEGPLFANFKKYIEKNGLENRIILAGYQENPYPIMNNCDIMLSTSTAEGMPNAILESIALGKPVVALDCKTGPREILECYKAGLLVAEDTVDAYKVAITRLLEDREVLDKRVVEKLTRDLSMESVGAVYSSVFTVSKTCNSSLYLS